MNRNVLVISNNCFSSSSNNGKTFESLFSGFEKRNISQLYFTDDIHPDFEFCEKYYRISDKDVFLNLFSFRKKFGGQVSKKLSIIESFTSSNKTTITNEKLKSVLRLCRDALWSSNSWKTDDLKKWCSGQNPDFIFFVGGGSSFSHNIAVFISNFLSIDLISFFTDDYILFPRKSTLFDYIQNFRMKNCYRRTVRRSTMCFAIGDMMCENYRAYFRKDFFPIMNSVVIEKYQEKSIHNNKIKVCYFGSLHTNRWKMISQLSHLLNKLNFKELELHVYSDGIQDQKILKSFSDAGIIYNGGVFGMELRECMLDSDILLHVESDDIVSKSMTKLSISTKIPEYLISGRAILGFGPRDIASMRYLIDNNIGIVVSADDNIDDAHIALSKLIDNISFRENLGKLGYDFAASKFDIKKITSDFYTKIAKAINSKL